MWIVAIQVKIETALGIAITKLAAEKKLSAKVGTPVANMWCSHTPKPTTLVATVPIATRV